MAISWKRVTAVTVGLIGVGAVVGAALGSTILLIIALPQIAHWSAGTFVFALVFGTVVGAPIGALGTPLLCWLLLRRVPLGRAIGVTSSGTVVGSLLGITAFHFVEGGGDMGSVYLIIGAVIGFVGSAVWLRLRALVLPHPVA